MKKLIILIFLLCSFIAKAQNQDTPPTGSNFKSISSHSISFFVPDSGVWMYKGAYGWGKIATYRNLKFKIDSLAHVGIGNIYKLNTDSTAHTGYTTLYRNGLKLNISDTAVMLDNYAKIAGLLLKLNISDTALMLAPYAKILFLALKLNISDTTGMLSSYAKNVTVNGKVDKINGWKLTQKNYSNADSLKLAGLNGSLYRPFTIHETYDSLLNKPVITVPDSIVHISRTETITGTKTFSSLINITGGTPTLLGVKALQLPTGSMTMDAGLSVRLVTGESIVQFGNNFSDYYTGNIDQSKAGSMIRLDTRNAAPIPGGHAYSAFQVQVRAAGTAYTGYTVPVQISGSAPEGTFTIGSNGVIHGYYGIYSEADITGNRIIKISGTSSQYLMADGSTSTGTPLQVWITENFDESTYGYHGQINTLSNTPKSTTSIQVQLNGKPLKSTQYILSTNTVKVNIPVRQYDLISISYQY